MADALAFPSPATHSPQRPRWPWRGLFLSVRPAPPVDAPDLDALLRSLLVL